MMAEEDLVVVRCIMYGRHTGDMATYDLDGRAAEVFAPTSRTFATMQSHWLRIRGGQAIEHWADRDDLGTARQLGWAPPTPPTSCAACSPCDGPAGPRRPMCGGAATIRPVGRRAPTSARSPRDRGDAQGPRGALRALRQPCVLDQSFADLDWVVHHVVADGDLAAVHLTVSGRQVGPVAAYDEADSIEAVFPPTRRRFAVTPTHWLRLADDGAVEGHWSDRDHLGMAIQPGWIPPTPAYAVRMARVRRSISRA
jgi:hypothetical protein